jgi:hypothetical protein
MPRATWLLILPTLLAATLPTPALRADRLENALIAEALEQPATLRFDGTLQQALDQVARETGVPVRLSGDAFDTLPMGQLTPVRGRFENVPLREAIALLAGKLALEMTRADGFVELRPLPAATRTGQPLTAQELSVLEALRRTPLPISEQRPTFATLLESIDTTLASLVKAGGATLQIEDRSRGVAPASLTIALPKNLTLYDALELLEAQTSVTWYPWDHDVVLVPKRDLHQRLLLKRVSLNYQDDQVERVLDHLQQQSGVRFRYEPGVLARIPPDRRTVTVGVSRATIRDVLDAIQRHTGLVWSADDEGVLIASRDRVAALLPLANGLLVPLDASQIPPSLRDEIDRETRELLDRLHRRAATTQPAE